MNNISFEFAHPWFLLVLVVAIPLALIPFFRLKKAKRRNRNRITSLILHIIIVLLCTLVLSGFTIKQTNSLQKKETFIVVDVSRSVGNQTDEIDAFVDNLLKDVDDNNKVGIVTFSNGATVASNLSGNTSAALSALQRERRNGADKATDINEALLFTAKQFRNKNNAKIVLITDGIDTENNLIIHSTNAEDVYEYTDNKKVLETVRAIAEQGVSIDTAYFEPVRYEKDMQINSVLFRKSVLLEELIDINVDVSSHVAATATLKLYDRIGSGNFELKDTITYDVKQGDNPNIKFKDFKFTKAGLHTLKVELSGYGSDQIAENNVYYSYVNIETNKTILIIDGDGKQGAQMFDFLSNMGYTPTKISPNGVPKGAAELSQYNEVIMMNVNVADLPKNYANELDTYVRTYGGGLFTTGGDQTYFFGGMDGTRFDSMLPINVIPEDNSVNGIVFVVDASGSMYYDFNKGGSSNSDCFYDESSAGFKNTPMNYIKTGLREAAMNIFNKKDYLALMHFGKSSPTYVLDLPLTPASQRGSFIGAINKIKTIKGTNWSVPLQAAAEHLRSTAYDVDKKQIIFITDGSPRELSDKDKTTDFAALTKGFEDNYEITTSVIAVNGCNTVDANLMNNITTALDENGNKRFYNCTTPEAFLKAISDECKAASTDIINEGGPYDVEITQAAENHTVFKGIVKEGQEFPQKGILPQVQKYNGFTVKRDGGVEALLTAHNVENGTHDAIYAQWKYGKGRVGSFASDLGDWAKDYYTDPEARMFLQNVIQDLLPEDSIKSTLAVEYEKKNLTTDIHVLGDLTDDKAVFIKITDPDGKVNNNGDKALRAISNNECVISVENSKEGLYTIELDKEDASGQVIESDVFYYTFSYSQEYNTFFGDYEELNSFLREVSITSNGRTLSTTDFEYNHQRDYQEETFDPKMIFAIIAAVLFILDIAARKFNFKWPHEWFRKKETEEA